MMNSRVQEWLINWFAQNAKADREELYKNISENYFQLGYIDSFEFITLIGDIEDEFNIEFENDQFEDRSFSTIKGMTTIIEGVLANDKI